MGMRALALGLLLAGCGGVTTETASPPHDTGPGARIHDAGTHDAEPIVLMPGIPGHDGGPSRPAGAAFSPCGAPVECQAGTQSRQYGTTCVCEPRCNRSDANTYGAASCPPAPEGSAPPFCDASDWCELPCKAFGDTATCPEGLACGVTLNGLRCITTPAMVAAFERPDPRTAIHDFELYGACRTYEPAKCPYVVMGMPIGAPFQTPADCSCSTLCFEDDDCPAPPAGYGPAVCLRADLSRKGLQSAGDCALVCADAENEFPCPPGLSCRQPPPATCDNPLFEKPSSNVSVCRGGYYHHGNGDETIDPGEVYGIQIPPSPTCNPSDPGVISSNGHCAGSCDPGVPWSSDGRCPGPECCADADCPAPPPGYPPAVCSSDGRCFVSCHSDADCPPGGYSCTNVNNPPGKKLLACN